MTGSTAQQRAPQLVSLTRASSQFAVELYRLRRSSERFAVPPRPLDALDIDLLRVLREQPRDPA